MNLGVPDSVELPEAGAGSPTHAGANIKAGPFPRSTFPTSFPVHSRQLMHPYGCELDLRSRARHRREHRR